MMSIIVRVYRVDLQVSLLLSTYSVISSSHLHIALISLIRREVAMRHKEPIIVI